MFFENVMIYIFLPSPKQLAFSYLYWYSKVIMLEQA